MTNLFLYKKLLSFLIASNTLLATSAYAYNNCATSPNPDICEQTNSLIRQAEELTGKPIPQPVVGVRAVSKTIIDPYIIEMRKSQGRSLELSDGEVYALSHKDLSIKESDIHKLITLASMSYAEADIEAAIIYYEKILDIEKKSEKNLPEQSSKFINESIDRLKNPNKFEGGIGFFIYELNKDGLLEKNNIKFGDIIIKINDKIMQDQIELSKLLASQSKNKKITIIRNNNKLDINLEGDGSAGAVITPLILYYAVQI